jgi:8-oxo-dGTP pyrophosphatase MutT (NUDIX family)
MLRVCPLFGPGCIITNSMIEKLRQALEGRDRLVIDDSRLTPSAVLIPIFQKDGKCRIVFTKRTSHLSHHKGQISFPGGGCHKDDKSLLGTALRESREEIGLKESDVEVIGELDDASTTTSFYRITPFVGLIPYPYDFKPDAFEVDEIFDVSIADLLAADTREENVQIDDHTIKTLTYVVDGRVIWGATAWILTQFLNIIRNLSEARCNTQPGAA